LYLPKNAYTKGVKLITFEGERPFPKAKTLSMLTSYLAFNKARNQNAYDALLTDRQSNVREGTRTNLFLIDGSRICTPPQESVLNGVTRTTLIQALKNKGINVEECVIPKQDLTKYQGCFLTSTSSNVLPISQIDDIKFVIPQTVSRIMSIYSDFLENYRKNQKRM